MLMEENQTHTVEQTIAVTGASAGIGRAIAKAFAAEGARVGLIARSAAALNEVKAEIEQAGGQALVLPGDVSQSEAVEAAADRIEAVFGPIDIWINCAMVTVFSPFQDIHPEEYRRVTEVTYHGAVFGSMAALKRMLPRRRGHIIQVGSALSYRAIPLQSAYCGAKYAVRGFSDSLRAELIHQKVPIDVSIVQLPAFNTPQFIWARNHTAFKPQPLPPIYAPALAARAVLWTARNPQREVWVGWSSWKAILGQKVFPGFLDRYVASTAWEGQFSDPRVGPAGPDNLFKTVDHLHSEEGPFADRTLEKMPRLWHVKNHNFWINGAVFALLFAIFLLGFILGSV
jgi:NAD(P)-dependent dehydrogenase (short-subunit alcohol dehydrogenase family)